MDATPSPSITWDPAEFRDRVQAVLSEFVADQAARLEQLGPDAARLTSAAASAVAGGKRLRAMFCYWGFRAVRPPVDDAEELALLRAAAALELLHASALVHDDYMDASDTRRGRPATHWAFAEEARRAGWPGNPDQYGAAAAILLGDLLLAWADERLRTSGLAQSGVLEALGYFDTTRSEVISGQFLDISVQARGESDVEQSMRVLRYKSAKYSVERPLHVGAALAGGDAGVISALTAYGVPVGEAFQLRDDLLGVFGDPRVTGKPAGGDLSEGKRTVLVALALQHCTDRDRDRLTHALGRSLTGREVAEVQRVIERSGSHGKVEDMITTLHAEAVKSLQDAPLQPDARAVLEELARAATDRVV